MFAGFPIVRCSSATSPCIGCSALSYCFIYNMHSIRSIVLTLSLATIIAAPSAVVAHEGHNHEAASSKDAVGELVRPTEKDAAWVAEQKAKYPTDACVVSEDKLGGDMGKPVDYIYRVE